jgi:iron(III)-enterobactin esterase
MARSSQRILFCVGLFVGACSSSKDPTSGGAGSVPSSGGGSSGASNVPPGQSSSGGSAGPSSGSSGSGGASSGGGSVAAGGASSSGSGSGSGATSTGTSSGGAGSSGGAASSGGTSSSGGASSGGSVVGTADGGVRGPGPTTDGGVVDPGTDGDGDFMVGPTYTKSADLTSKGAPTGKSFHFTMNSTASKIFLGMDTTLLAANQHSFTRGVDVYVPAKYKDGTSAPFMVIQDGPGQIANIKLALDNLTQSTDPTRRLPAFIAIAVQNGGGDSKGSERGLEYDTMSDRYAQFIQTEVIPAVLADTTIKAAFPNLALTSDPDGRGAVGCSSGAAAAFTMGWFRPEWFRRIVTYSGTLVAQQNDTAPEQAMYPLGAWDYHSVLNLVGTTDPPKPMRVFINANQNDNGAGTGDANHHDWLLANQRTAAALKTKNYHYRFVEGLGAAHCDGRVQDLTMADTLLWVWRGYPIN